MVLFLGTIMRESGQVFSLGIGGRPQRASGCDTLEEAKQWIRATLSRWLALYPDTHFGKPLQHSPLYTLLCFSLLIAAYVVFDQANSQKNEFRLRRAGVVIDRVAFPQLPWAILKDPQFLKTSNGGTLLVDGWYQYCRKPHYMADILQALCWGLICGFEVLLPYWYVCFFVPMIIHRAVRDDARCAEKYGADWDTYIKRVPYVFVPGLV